jgi:replicative DNA helicase Mcm
MDEKLADHIIISRTEPKMIEPVIGVHLLRKYIAYAKQIKEMELTYDAAQSLKNFYVDMRNRYAGSEVPVVSITLRQYEALLRLAEASAKVRLDTKVRTEDAERAINLMKYSLIQLGYDYETERFDIDRMESGITAVRRRKITVVMDIITELQKLGKEIAIDDIKAEAETRGIEDIDDIIERFKREGTIFEPRAGYVRKL